MKKLLLTSVLLVGSFFGGLSMAQDLRFVLKDGENTQEIAPGSKVEVQYHYDAEIEETESILSGYFKTKKEYQSLTLKVEKITHKGNKNWGVSSVCFGSCTPVEGPGKEDIFTFLAEGLGSSPLLVENENDPEKNILDLHTAYLNDLLQAENVYEVKYSFWDNGTELYSFFVSYRKGWDKAVEDIKLENTKLLNLNGEYVLQYEGQRNDLTLAVYDLMGRLVHSALLPASGQDYVLPRTLSEGNFVLRLSAQGATVFVQKFNVAR